MRIILFMALIVLGLLVSSIQSDHHDNHDPDHQHHEEKFDCKTIDAYKNFIVNENEKSGCTNKGKIGIRGACDAYRVCDNFPGTDETKLSPLDKCSYGDQFDFIERKCKSNHEEDCPQRYCFPKESKAWDEVHGQAPIYSQPSPLDPRSQNPNEPQTNGSSVILKISLLQLISLILILF